MTLPGSRASAAEMSPEARIPWTMRPPKRVSLAQSSSRWMGFVSPEAAAKRSTSAPVSVFVKRIRSPTES